MLTTQVTTDNLQRLGKIIGTVVKDILFFMNMELGHHLPVLQLVYFLE
jgi:hypothetical protein